MLSLLTGILSRDEEVWVHATKAQMQQSYWDGWLLTFITNKFLPQISTRDSKGDPILMLYMHNIQISIAKVVSV